MSQLLLGEKKGKRKKWKRVICLLLFSSCSGIILPHFDVESDEIYSSHTHTHTHTPNADESTYTITRTKFHPPSLLSRAALHYSWDWNLLSVCRLQTPKEKEKNTRTLYTHSQVMTLHILRWMAITVHQCSAEFIPKMIEATEDTDACCQIYNEILHWT